MLLSPQSPKEYTQTGAACIHTYTHFEENFNPVYKPRSISAQQKLQLSPVPCLWLPSLTVRSLASTLIQYMSLLEDQSSLIITNFLSLFASSPQSYASLCWDDLLAVL